MKTTVEKAKAGALVLLTLAAVTVQAKTYRLRDHDTYSNNISHTSFADPGQVSRNGAGWVNVDDPSDTANFPAAGNDYLADGKTLRTTESTSGCTFAGETLTLLTPDYGSRTAADLGTTFGRLMFKNKGSSTVTIADLRVENGAITFSDTYANLGIPVLAGRMTVVAGDQALVGTLASGDTGDRRGDIRSTLVGSGTLVVGFASADTTAYFSGDMSGFTGRVLIDHDGSKFASLAGGGKMVVSESATWFGNPSAVDNAGVTFQKAGKLCFMADVASTGVNRGFKFKGSGATLDVAEGKSVTIDGPLSGTGGFVKSGEGTLTLTGDNSGLSGIIAVSAGRLVAGSDTALGSAEVVTTGAGVFVPYGNEESSEPVVCVWTGAADDYRWDSPNNWDGLVVPRRIDTAVFTDSGMTNGCRVLVSGRAVASNLVIRTELAFTFAEDESGSMTLQRLEREDVDGATEGYVDFRVPVALLGDANSECVWTIGGSNGIRLYGALTKVLPTAMTLRKLGGGSLDLYSAATEYRSQWSVEEGKLVSRATGALGGTITIGGGEAKAEVAQGVDSSLVGGATVKVATNGTFTSGSRYSDYGRMSTLEVRDGGTASLLSYFGDYLGYVTLRGSTITGRPTAAYTLTSEASAVMSYIDGTWDVSSYSDRSISVADGEAPVDLKVKLIRTNSPDTYTLKKTGAGTLRTTSNCTELLWPVSLEGGVWLADNPSQYGLGKNKVTVKKGACLGGCGFVGAASVQSTAAVTLESGTESSFATIAPGSVDETTGAHVFGTLTVASEATTNNVSLGSYAHLRAGLAARQPGSPAYVADQLVVHGALTIGANAVLDLASSSASAGEIRAGRYRVAHADNGIAGEFATVLKPAGLRCSVDYVLDTATGKTCDIEAVVNRGLVLLIK